MNDIVNNFAEETNPVIDTARLTISQLAVSGVREAAGLRTLLIMQKDLCENKVCISGASKVILDIFYQTGFTEMFELG